MRSAAYRIAFAYSAAFALAIALLGLTIFWSMHLAFTRQLDAVLLDDASTLDMEYRSDGSGELIGAITQRETAGFSQRLLYALYAPDGRRVHGALVATRPAPGLQDIADADLHGRRGAVRALAMDLPDGSRLVVAADHERIDQVDRIVISVFGAGFLFVLAFGAIAALLLGAYLRRRLQAIAGTAEAIIAGDMERRIPVSPHDDEFDRLARSLNAMLERIAGLIENVRQVSSDVAHDLRTPLARLRNKLESGLRDEGDRGAVVADAIRRVDELLSLFAAILRIAEVESGNLRILFARVDLSALATELAESYAPAVADGRQSLEWSIVPNLATYGDRELIAQAIVNLLDNARRHTPEGTAIQLALQPSGDRIRLSVADDGPGVPKADRERIVRRFARLDESRTTPGHGLGLNLVAAVARLHDTELVLNDNAPGLIAMLDFPIAAVAEVFAP
jgi:signal transduction histidine kinase